MNYFAWLYVGTIEVSRDYGRVAIDQFTSEAEKSGICIAFREILPTAKDINGLTHLGEYLFWLFAFAMAVTELFASQ